MEVASDNFWATPKEDLQVMFDLDPDAFLAEVDNAPPKLKAKNYRKMFNLVPAFWKWYNKTLVALQKRGIENPNVIKQYKLLEADMGDPITSTQIECK